MRPRQITLSDTDWGIIFEAVEYCWDHLPYPERREDYPAILAKLRRRGIVPPHERRT